MLVGSVGIVVSAIVMACLIVPKNRTAPWTVRSRTFLVVSVQPTKRSSNRR